MIKLKAPIVAEPQSHKEALAAKKIENAQLLLDLNERFKEYQAFTPDMENLPQRSISLDPFLSVLHSLYDSEAAAVVRIKDAVWVGKPTRCPYCGRTASPSTLDHFLPRSKHQEFSLFASNLIPACWECNHTKSTQIWDKASGLRLYLNPYFDSFLDKHFVHAEIIPDDISGYDVPLFKIHFEWHGSTPQRRQTCESHFTLLKISGMLRTEFAAKLRALKRRFVARLDKPLAVAQIKTELVAEESGADGEHGPNCWESIFLRSVIKNIELLEWLSA